MSKRTLSILLAALVVVPVLAQTPIVSPTYAQRGVVAKPAQAYFPERFDWQHKRPEESASNTCASCNRLWLSPRDKEPTDYVGSQKKASTKQKNPRRRRSPHVICAIMLCSAALASTAAGFSVLMERA